MASILILEDDPISIKILKKIVERDNHTVYTAQNIKEAWEQISAVSYMDIIILDKHLNCESGLDFLEKLRMDPLYKNIPVLVCMGQPDRRSVVQFARMGVQNVLAKPYQAEAIQVEIEKALSSSSFGNLFENMEDVCERLGITQEDYIDVMKDTASLIYKTLPDLTQACRQRNFELIDSFLGTLQSSSVNVGYISLMELCERLRIKTQKGDIAAVEVGIKRFPAMISIIESHFGIKCVEAAVSEEGNNTAEEVKSAESDAPTA